MQILRILLLAILLIQSFNGNSTLYNFTGRWCWEADSDQGTFELRFKKIKDHYKGEYHCINKTGRSDENERAFDFKDPQTNLIQTKAIIGWRERISLVQMKLVNDKLEWLVFKEPEGFTMVPIKAVLKRC